MKKGFTLIELLVVLVIMSLITLVFLENQTKFDSSTVMRSLAYSIALSVRQAQVYGTSIIEDAPGSGVFGPVYGISFTSAAGSTYFIFADPNPNTTPDKVGQFDTGAAAINTFSISNTYSIQEVCAVTATSVWRCSGSDDTSGLGSIATLDILFKRPNPDATITAFQSGSSPGSPEPIAGDSYAAAYVQLAAIDNDVRVIKTYLTGQIVVCGSGNLTAANSASNFSIKSIKAGTAQC